MPPSPFRSPLHDPGTTVVTVGPEDLRQPAPKPPRIRERGVPFHTSRIAKGVSRRRTTDDFHVHGQPGDCLDLITTRPSKRKGG